MYGASGVKRKIAFVSGRPHLHLCGRLARQQLSERHGEPFTASMPTLRRCGAVKPRSPKGAPKAQGLTAPHRRRTIADAVNREAMYVITSARPLPPLCVQIFFIITLSLPIPQKTRCAEHAVKSGAGELHASTICDQACNPNFRPYRGCCFRAFILHDGELS